MCSELIVNDFKQIPSEPQAKSDKNRMNLSENQAALRGGKAGVRLVLTGRCVGLRALFECASGRIREVIGGRCVVLGQVVRCRFVVNH